MQGLVNQAVADLARTLGGDDLWQRVLDGAGLQGTTFVATDAYDDDVTDRLVTSASQALDLPEEQVLRALGRHWVLFTGREGYGALLPATGTTVPELLRGLDAMHARVTVLVPGTRPPSFACEEVGPTRLLLRYRSHRAGLTPMVHGLLEGVGELLGSEVVVVGTWDHEQPDALTDVTFVVDHAAGTPAAEGLDAERPPGDHRP